MDSLFRANAFMPLFFSVYLVGSSILTLLAYWLFPGSAVFVSTVLIYCLLFGGAFLLFPDRTSSRTDALGLRRIPGKTILFSLLTGFLMQPTLLLISYLSQFLFRDLVSSSVSDMLTMPLPALFLITAVLPALCEEFLCRGLIQRSYRNQNMWVGILVSSLFFALLHGNIQQSLYALAAGLIFGFMSAASGSVWPSVIAHLTVNGSQILALALMPAAEAGTEAAAEAVVFSWAELGYYAELTLYTLPLTLLCLWRIRCHGEDTRPSSADRFRWPEFRRMWPFYLYLILALGLCLSAELLPA